MKYECALKNSSNQRVVIRKWSLVICKGFFCMTTLWFDKFFCECALKNLSNHRVVIRKNPLQITSDHFRMTTLWFDEFFNAHSYLILNITNFWLLNLEFANLWSHEVNSSQITNLGKLRYMKFFDPLTIIQLYSNYTQSHFTY